MTRGGWCIAGLMALSLTGLLANPALAQRTIIEEVAPPPKAPPRPKPKPLFQTPKLLWRVAVGKVEGTPAFDGKSLLLGGSDAFLMLDAEGRPQGRLETGPQLAGPAYDDNRAYISSDQGTLYAFTRSTGVQAWKFPTDGGASLLTTPAVGAGRVYFEATDNNVYCVDSAHGQLKWKYTRADGSLGYSSPVFQDNAVFVCGETTVYRLNAADGVEMWKSYIGGKSLSTIEAGGGRLYVGGDGVGLVSLSPTQGTVLWSFPGKIAGDWFGTPLYSNGTVYVSTYNRMVYAVDAATGKVRWSYQLLGSALSRPVLDAKRATLYVTSTTYRDNPTLTAVNIKTGKKAWDYKVGHTTGSPVITGDRLYVGTNAGFLYAFSLK